ncbi:hypothetical protein [Aeribacillus composti]|uniref:hypothetical protein n=1 Tax=Aeribacillus composti TaxID=1868734 RepID=UPI003D242A92
MTKKVMTAVLIFILLFSISWYLHEQTKQTYVHPSYEWTPINTFSKNMKGETFAPREYIRVINYLE